MTRPADDVTEAGLNANKRAANDPDANERGGGVRGIGDREGRVDSGAEGAHEGDEPDEDHSVVHW